MNKLSAVLIFALAFTFSANAQEGGNNAIGVRLGPSTPVIKSGITFQHYLAEGLPTIFGSINSTGFLGFMVQAKVKMAKNLPDGI